LHIVHRVIVSIRSGKFLFHDWKSQGKVREFYYARPVGTLIIDQYTDVFSGLGCYPGEYRIVVDPSVMPVVNPAR